MDIHQAGGGGNGQVGLVLAREPVPDIVFDSQKLVRLLKNIRFWRSQISLHSGDMA